MNDSSVYEVAQLKVLIIWYSTNPLQSVMAYLKILVAKSSVFKKCNFFNAITHLMV